MKLVKVTGREFIIDCVKCGAKLYAGDGHDIYADIEGKPFKDYYCKTCANKSKIVEVVK
jgi:hypothetical protein